MEFYAYKTDETGNIIMNVNVEIYLAGTDSMPTGSPIASTVVPVDTAFGGGVLNILRKIAVFNPVSVSQPYVVVISNPSPNNIGLIINSYNAGDGAGEWLASANIGGAWLRSYDITIGGPMFDADALFQPIVSYDLKANFTTSDPCFLSGNDQVFTNASSPINTDRMYNITNYMGITEMSYTWDYGDASLKENLIDGVHTYSAAGIYNVTLTDTIFGWTRNCFTDTTITIGDIAPVADWSSSATDLDVDFTDMSTTSTTYSWDFGDGNTSILMNPTHTYATAGTYTVCLTVTSTCGNDMDCQSVTVTASSAGLNDLIDNQTVVYPNPVKGIVNVASKELMSEIKLLDLTGKTIGTYAVNTLETSIDLSNLAHGQYMLEAVFLNGSKSNFRILVQQ